MKFYSILYSVTIFYTNLRKFMLNLKFYASLSFYATRKTCKVKISLICSKICNFSLIFPDQKQNSLIFPDLVKIFIFSMIFPDQKQHSPIFPDFSDVVATLKYTFSSVQVLGIKNDQPHKVVGCLIFLTARGGYRTRYSKLGILEHLLCPVSITSW